ncbi:unnamed protein product [Medioppia subpectinata]|uniref:BTB domain-containing protein n=1 Tax=Medioppia subpectinata TaxID=1979941 RepID=A0A7R9L1U3_9ACAR|nr:unnamed protein product [Medioppia subpectinata]CAG2113682.1 unnamed protein product [Medioppia subpectinata]
MDSLCVLQTFPDLCPQLVVTEEDDKLRIKLLSVFGDNGEEVIVVTTNDIVFVFGANRFGRLGLGVNGLIAKPHINPTLTGAKIMKICYGLGHCLGLTSGGQCYGWGHNACGQIGIGSVEDVLTPQSIKIQSNALQPKEVEDISCGDNHSLVLTIDGLIYSFGANDRRQCGQTEGQLVCVPTIVSIEIQVNGVPIDVKFKSIACGRNHSCGLSDTGTAYVWGSNDSQQLGPKARVVTGQTYSCPHALRGYEKRVCRALMCGPNHTVLMSPSGAIHVLGDSEWSADPNSEDICENKRFKYMDSAYDNHMIIVTDMDGQHSILGKAGPAKTCIPIDVSIGCSLFDIYAKYCGFDRTFASIFKFIRKFVPSMKTFTDSDEEIYSSDADDEEADRLPTNTGTVDNNSIDWSHRILGCFQKHLLKAFDNRLDSDLRFIVENKVIYCHKTVLKIRNKEFWRICEQNMINERDIEINAYSYDTIEAFLKYLYGLRPEVNDQNCRQLLGLAEEYGERGLKNICSQYSANCV